MSAKSRESYQFDLDCERQVVWLESLDDYELMDVVEAAVNCGGRYSDIMRQALYILFHTGRHKMGKAVRGRDVYQPIEKPILYGRV